MITGVLAFHLVGCATRVTGNVKKLNIKTEPAGARVTVYDLKRPVYDKNNPKVAVMRTPCQIPLRTASHYSTARYFVTIEKPGYRPLGFEVHAAINAWYFGNLDPLLIPLFPLTMGLIDPMSGSMWTLKATETDRQLVGSRQELQNLSQVPDAADVPVIRLSRMGRGCRDCD
jgi:hypothetical protein